jgi:hypothetical protein
MDMKIAEESDQEEKWDEQGDQTVMPGGFGAETAKKPSRAMAAPRTGEEAPMSIFDLTRASAAQAQRSFSSIAALGARGRGAGSAGAGVGAKGSNAMTQAHDDTVHIQEGEDRVRKRDQLRNAAVGTLASGIGWMIGAQPPPPGAGEKQ